GLVVDDEGRGRLPGQGVLECPGDDLAVVAAARDRLVQRLRPVVGLGHRASVSANASGWLSRRTYQSPRLSFDGMTLARALRAVYPSAWTRTGSRSSETTSGRSSLSAARRSTMSSRPATSTGSEPR